MAELPKQYNPHEHETRIYQQWEESGAFAPSPDALKAGEPPYVIMLPPPNITGSLHMGHALQDTIMDTLVRYHRMHGRPVLWQPGTDHAALPTNKIIVEQLAAEGTTPANIGRDAFLQRASEWYDKTGAVIINQMKRLGCSCDWNRHRFTMDDAYYHAVEEAFIRYYERGYIYRGARIVNWDPKTKTTVSDLEIDYQTETAPFYYFQYGPFEIGTARPETKFGDKYVVIHPDDERYQQYQHGDTFETEWINGPITATIIKDEASDPNLGSGVMTITPWHSAVDFDIAQRHNLDMEPIIDLAGNLLPVAGEFAGLSISEARPKIVAKLEAKGLLNRIDENYEHNIALNDRGKGVIEPQVMRQWFVDMSKLKDETIAAVSDDAVRFVPPRWKKHFLNWMHGVRDWNINRQIWLGHRLPVWWQPGTHGTDNEDGNFVVSRAKPAAGEWEQDPDVLDTWFSSALWPFATLSWPDATDDLATFYPTSVLVTARDILYLWVARMIFSGLELMQGSEYGDRDQAQRLPFKDVLIHPTVLTREGQRMSKSLGTGIDPLDLIEEYGADATRFGLLYQMSYDNQAIKFDADAVKSARNFANKLWNIARFLAAAPERTETSAADQWIRTRSHAVQREVEKLTAEYKLGEAARLLYEFVWNEYADWYIEMLKVTGSRAAALDTFQRILLMLHPMMPHVTEVLWQHLKPGEVLITTAWPAAEPESDPELEAAMTYLQDLVTTVRSARALLSLKPNHTVTIEPEAIPLMPEVVAALCRAEAGSGSGPSVRLTLADGRHVTLWSSEITDDKLATARAQVARDLAATRQQLEQTDRVLAQMNDHGAPADKITAKTDARSRLKRRLTELERSALL